MSDATKGFVFVGRFDSTIIKHDNDHFKFAVKVERNKNNHMMFYLRVQLHSTLSEGKAENFVSPSGRKSFKLQTTGVTQIVVHPEKPLGEDLLNAFCYISQMCTRHLTRGQISLSLDADGICVDEDQNTSAEAKLVTEITKTNLQRFLENVKYIIQTSWINNF